MDKKLLALFVVTEIALWPIGISIYAVATTSYSWLSAHNDELMIGAALIVAALVLPRNRES